MTDLNTLRPEVRSAIHDLAVMATLLSQYQQLVGIVRAELLRLADENARLSERVSDTEHFRDVHIRAAGIFRKRAGQAESELAALKARIAEAPTAQLIDQGRATQQWLALPPALSGKRVRLVVEE